MGKFKNGRHFLHAGDWKNYEGLPSEEQQKMPHPPLVKPVPVDAVPLKLVKPEDFISGKKPFIDLVNQRKSRRKFTDDLLTYEELSYLLWCTQGVKKTLRSGVATFRTVPSGGARHSFETYLWINRVEGLAPGLYRYLPLEHQILIIREAEDKGENLSGACLGQSFVGKAAVTFIWTTIPHRAEWRYSVVAHKMIALDAGHMCQNLYLAAESFGAGTCAVGAYDQEKMDRFLNVDGIEEFTIYIAPVGYV